MNTRVECYSSIRLAWWVYCFAFAGLTSVAASAQDNTTKSPTSEAASAGDLEFVGLSRAPHSRAQIGSILTCTAVVRNRSDHDVRAELVGRLATQTGEEDRRRILIPAKTFAAFDLDIRILPTLQATSVDVVVTLNIIEFGREVMIRTGSEPISKTLTTNVVTDTSRAAFTLGPEPIPKMYWRWPPDEPFYTYEMVIGSRVDAGLSRICMNLENQPLPISLSDWMSIDVVVIADPEVLNDAASIAALQQFLLKGGRLWVMLDRVDVELIRPLLASDQQIEEVDTVAINRVTVESPSLSGFSEADRTLVSETPLLMKRVLQTGGQTAFTVDGWPIAIWMPIDRGQILITTLEAKGWVLPRSTQTTSDEMYQSNFRLPPWSGPFSNNLHAPKPSDLFASQPAEYPLERIGNPVVSRQFVTVVLLGFVATIGCVGFWRWVAGELRWIGLLAPAIACCAAVPMIWAAYSQRKDMPDMVSVLQEVQYGDPNPGIIRESGAVYTSSSQEMTLSGQVDGYATPAPGIESGIRKMVTDDFHQWRLTNEAWPAGTWRYRTESTLDAAPSHAFGRFSKLGLEVQLPIGLTGKLTDLVVAYSAGNPTLLQSTTTDGKYLLDGRLPAGGERWSTDSLVDAEQLRRAAVYRHLFEAGASNRRQPVSHSLLGWSEIYSSAPQWDRELQKRGAALVSMPLRLEPPKVGQEIRIPHSLIEIRPPDSGSTSIYNAAAASWVEESNLDTNAGVVFQLPSEAIPLEATQIEIDLDIRAPKRNVRLYWSNGEQSIDIVSLKEPSLPWSATITEPLMLADLRDGKLQLVVEVKDTRDASQSQGAFISWQLKHLRVSVYGKVLPTHNLATDS